MESPAKCALGDQSTTDVAVKILTDDGRDYVLHCHAHILSEKSKFLASLLSNNPTTIELRCCGSNLDHLVNLLRALYISDENLVESACTGVKNAIGMLRMAEEYGCRNVVSACVTYLEAVPWEEGEEDEILKVVPRMGRTVEPVLARVQPVGECAVKKVFLSAARFALSSPCLEKEDLKVSAQEQLEYMLDKDGDAPMLLADEEMKRDVNGYVLEMFDRFTRAMGSASDEDDDGSITCLLSDLLWSFQILTKMESGKEFVRRWVDAAEMVIERVEGSGEERGKAIDITAKVLDAMAYGSVVVPAADRIRAVTKWLPFVRSARAAAGGAGVNGEVWQGMQSAFVLIVLTLPSEEQAEILREWIESENLMYPDLTEAFEIWCYRAKIARARLGEIRSTNGGNDGI